MLPSRSMVMEQLKSLSDDTGMVFWIFLDHKAKKSPKNLQVKK